MQTDGTHPVAEMYQAILQNKELFTEQIEAGIKDLHRLNKQRDALWIRLDGIRSEWLHRIKFVGDSLPNCYPSDVCVTNPHLGAHWSESDPQNVAAYVVLANYDG